MKIQNISYLVLLMVFTSVKVNAQYRRYTDIEVKFLSPADGTEIQSPEWIHIEFSIKNLGPDSIYTGDSCAYILMTTDGIVYAPRRFALQQDIFPMDSVIIRDSIYKNSKRFKQEFVLVFRHEVAIFAIASEHGPLDGEFEVDRHNNRPSITFFHLGHVSAETLIQSNDDAIICYPNPTSGYIQIRGIPKTEVEAVYLQSLDGKKVLIDIDNGKYINLDNAGNGLHILELHTLDGIVRKKVLILRE
ncbi:MAG: hypothetical protein ACI8ZN_000343 [Bacteroidia bacterium]|jgi:hypothetical protein